MSYWHVANPEVDDHRDAQLRGQTYFEVLTKVHGLASKANEKRSEDGAMAGEKPKHTRLPEDPVKTIRVSCARVIFSKACVAW